MTWLHYILLRAKAVQQQQQQDLVFDVGGASPPTQLPVYSLFVVSTPPPGRSEAHGIESRLGLLVVGASEVKPVRDTGSASSAPDAGSCIYRRTRPARSTGNCRW